MKTSTRNETAKQRLEYLRGELRAERISYDGLHELQSLKAHIEPGDVELLEAAGVPEFGEQMQKHTPGPWRIGQPEPMPKTTPGYPDSERYSLNPHSSWKVLDDDPKAGNRLQHGNLICHVYNHAANDCSANARLIASAPDLLAIAKHLLHACETPGDFTQAEFREMMDDAAAAIARATGGAI